MNLRRRVQVLRYIGLSPALSLKCMREMVPHITAPRSDVILSYIRDNGRVRGTQVAANLALCGIPSTTTFAYLTQLVKQGVILRSGTRRRYVYSLTLDNNSSRSYTPTATKQLGQEPKKVTMNTTTSSPFVPHSRFTQKMELKKVRLSELATSKIQPEHRTDIVAGIAADIAEIGLVEPIAVEPRNYADPYTIINGHRRADAIRSLCAPGADPYVWVMVHFKVNATSAHKSFAINKAHKSADLLEAYLRSKGMSPRLSLAKRTLTGIKRLIDIFGGDEKKVWDACVTVPNPQGPAVLTVMNRLHDLIAMHGGEEGRGINERQTITWIAQHKGIQNWLDQPHAYQGKNAKKGTAALVKAIRGNFPIKPKSSVIASKKKVKEAREVHGGFGYLTPAEALIALSKK